MRNLLLIGAVALGAAVLAFSLLRAPVPTGPATRDATTLDLGEALPGGVRPRNRDGTFAPLTDAQRQSLAAQKRARLQQLRPADGEGEAPADEGRVPLRALNDPEDMSRRMALREQMRRERAAQVQVEAVDPDGPLTPEQQRVLDAAREAREAQ